MVTTDQALMNVSDARALCNQVWPSEQIAHEVAEELGYSGFDVVHYRHPAYTQDRAAMSVAWVRMPDGGRTVGDVLFRVGSR